MTDTDIYLCSKISIQNMSSTNHGQYHNTKTPKLNTHKEDTCVHQAYVPTTDNCAAAQVAICRLSTGKTRVWPQVSPAELLVEKVALRWVFLRA